MILYINSCIREDSRTERLANVLLEKLGEYTEVKLLEQDIHPLNRETLAFRQRLVDKGDYSHPIFDRSKQFADADCIVIAAPYWDLSFPALLKTYVENIFVTGIVAKYGADGLPRGMCKAQKFYYVTTAGGPYDRRFGYEYLKAVFETQFGIKESCLIYADMLDVDGYDVEQLLKEAADGIKI